MLVVTKIVAVNGNGVGIVDVDGRVAVVKIVEVEKTNPVTVNVLSRVKLVTVVVTVVLMIWVGVIV